MNVGIGQKLEASQDIYCGRHLLMETVGRWSTEPGCASWGNVLEKDDWERIDW